MDHPGDDPGPLADVQPDHGDAGTPVPPWAIVLLALGAVALLIAFFWLLP